MRRLADLTKDLEKLGEETVRAQLMRGDYGLPGLGTPPMSTSENGYPLKSLNVQKREQRKTCLFRVGLF